MNSPKWWENRFDHTSSIGLKGFFTNERMVWELILRLLPIVFFFIAGFVAPVYSILETREANPQLLRWVCYEVALLAGPCWYFWLLRRARAAATDTRGSRADRLVLGLCFVLTGLIFLVLGILFPPGTRLEF